MTALRLVCLIALTAGGVGGRAAWAGECDHQYFAVDAQGVDTPQARPSATLAKMLREAKAGDAVAQRNLAISYDSGYLVSPCHAQAVRWYRAAAQAGDEVASQWLQRHEARKAFSDGPECGEAGCRSGAAAEVSSAVLYPDSSRNNHYFAPLTINGKTARGMIDTGASTVSMSAEMAKMFGIDTAGGKTGQSATANGQISTTTVVVPQIEVAGIALRNVAVSIGISDGILIGMSFLGRMNISVVAGAMTLSKK